MPRLKSITVPSLALLAIAAGCASWSDRVGTGSQPPKSSLVPARESRKAVIIEVEFVPIAVDGVSADDMESLWQWVDEAAIETDGRIAMAENGFRGGRLIHPERFRARLATLKHTTGIVDEFLGQAEVASTISHGRERIPMRLGRRHELPLKQPDEGSEVTLVRMNHETIGRTLEHPQFLLAVTPTATSTPRQIRLRLRPEVQHGSMRQRWVSSDTALRIDTRRDTWSLPELDLNVDVSEGQTLALAPDSPLRGLGKQMFTGHSANQQREQLVVLINIAQVPKTTELN